MPTGGASPAADARDAFSVMPRPDHRWWPPTNGVTGSGREPIGSVLLRAQGCGGVDASGQRTRTGVPKSPVVPRNDAPPVNGVRCFVMVIIMVSPPLGLVLNGAREHYPHPECLRKHFRGIRPESVRNRSGIAADNSKRPGVTKDTGPFSGACARIRPRRAGPRRRAGRRPPRRPGPCRRYGPRRRPRGSRSGRRPRAG